MIVAPDFFEHWKTKALIELTKRPESPLWLQRLWAHCQTRKTWKFRDLSDLALKSICSVPTDITPEAWKDALLKSYYIRESGKSVIVHQWEEHNASLVQRWESGRRPKQKRTRSGDQAEHNPHASDREDRIEGIEKKGGNKPKTADKPRDQAEVSAYFLSQHSTESEAGKFFDHFEANGWRQGGRTPMRSWQAAGRNWIRRAGDFGKNSFRGGAAGGDAFNPETPGAHTGGLLEIRPAVPAATSEAKS